MNCSIISIGTELNLGLILNTNSKYIAEKMTGLGIECRYMFTASDRADDISEVLKLSLKYSDLIIITGGLGPTDDDITREAVSKYCNSELVLDEDVLNNIERFFKERNKEMPQTNKKQAYIPKCAQTIANSIGSAAGIRIQTSRHCVGASRIMYDSSFSWGKRRIRWQCRSKASNRSRESDPWKRRSKRPAIEPKPETSCCSLRDVPVSICFEILSNVGIDSKHW